ncbi:MlaE family ABC transporter permease [Horticoccus sp. 23ND18S-11]|uniref:MlaE family ABC transporter permease n=1 Tax=Horticoccus sp. 23ND18S-11 TaxID=3391832 RepID=UPI0039C9DE84
MSASLETGEASATAMEIDGGLDVALGGTWQITSPRPSWSRLLGDRKPARVRVRVDDVTKWDTSLLLFLFEMREWSRATGVMCDTGALPEKIRMLLSQLLGSHESSVPFDRSVTFLASIGLATQDSWRKVREFSRFVGDFVISAVQFARSPHRFRWGDCISEMQQCGAMALPIVSLISFLVGVTLAYTGAIVLRQYGGDIFIADLIGLSMVREMGAVMTAVVLAGRTGAAFAATLGNMKANEEIDALETLGISAVHFLVLPRMLALLLMMPLLTLYANALGILGGMAVALGLLSISPTAYWIEMLTIVDLSDLFVGIIKGTTFGFIIGLAGCLRGLQSERSAVGVGQAATSAVVTAILLIIVADAIFAVVFNILGW